MAPKKSKPAMTKTAPQIESDSDEPTQSQEASQSQSQEFDAKAIEAVVQKQNEQSRARKAQRAKEIEATKKQRIDKIQRKMTDLKKAHEQELRTIQAPKIARLRDLIQKRRDIDNKIAACWGHIDQAYESTTQQYQFALGGRLEDLG
ncbi:hypothetical protein M409DRAFT_21103 [Zasmidium cellare ATCC 36951]|uniref:Uncharacterized protein n=1 Tax=Zasmidium cellare ATCC 36951 TaxID=1080233 RepID=A0A6A6CTD2_ZASCE|nr:uncharacterized protein M409DRAFT_21103 [Zasmidium cellare ATCC 36951]KAF2169092.1 hypothetical protein M409DRAFT_21103 [Zasmidium cellare ATCC 36951]